MSPGWWSRWRGLAVGLAFLTVIVGLDIGLGLVLSASYPVAAVLLAVLATVRRTAVIAVLAVALSALSGVWNHNFGTAEWRIRLILAASLAALAVISAVIRVRRERDLRHMTMIAETAQRAVLRVMPDVVGSVGFAARYVSATREALVGGDLYEVVASPYGVRVIVGDVRGKGIDAVQLAATVLGRFRRAAFAHPSLSEVASSLDAIVSAVASDEDFVTAVLAEFHDDHTVTLVNCGHHPPMLVTATDDRLLPTGEPVPPLGLGPRPSQVTAAWPADSRMLIYTDGLVEARDRRGRFFPLAAHAHTLREGTLEDALDRLVSGLTAHSGHQVTDDLALVLVEHRGG